MKFTSYTYELEFVTDKNHERRSVAFLVSANVKITAKKMFDSFKENDQRFFMTRFDYWVTGKKHKDFHGWNLSEFGGKYKKCFVFRRVNYLHRFYGFLCNPKQSNSSYQLCVLVTYARKKENETDLKYLDWVEEFRTTTDIEEAISRLFKR